MDEISKLGDINSINDLFDFKISIKTIIFLTLAWGAVCLVIIVFLFGGINNTVAYTMNIIESIKSTVIDSRNKHVNKPVDKPVDNSPETNTDKNNE